MKERLRLKFLELAERDGINIGQPRVLQQVEGLVGVWHRCVKSASLI
jgi:hypothetical protein